MDYIKEQHYPFTLPALPYAYSALEPYIDEETMHLHHDGHLQTYINNLNKALKDHPLYHTWTLERLLKNIMFLPKEIRTAVKNNAGGVYNHVLFFNIMTPNSPKMPVGNLAEEIDRQFGSFDRFKQIFSSAAASVFGSGFAWLVSDRMGNLKVLTTPNQDTVVPLNLMPIILLDVWEHAYYLKYHNLRDEYIQNWYNVVDWEEAERLFNQING